VSRLAALQELDLRNNRLTALPESLGQLSGLWELTLEDNQLTALPESLGQFSKLHKLLLENNPIQELPREVLRTTQDGFETPAKPQVILDHYFRKREEAR